MAKASRRRRPQPINLPAGPFFRIGVTGLQLDIGGNLLGGSLSIDQSGVGADKITRVGITGVNISVGGSGITNGEGAFVLMTPAAGAGLSGVAGFVSGTATGALNGVTLTGNAGFRFNKTGKSIDEMIEVAGRSLIIRFSDAETNIFQFFAENLSLNIANFVTISGDVTFISKPGKDVFAGQGLELFLGRGPPRLANGDLNPIATGLLLTNARIGLVKFTSGGTSTYALSATGTVQVVGVNGITVLGTALIRVNTGLAINETISIPGTDSDVVVLFQPDDGGRRRLTLRASRRRIPPTGVLGQTLQGDFTFDKITTAERRRALRSRRQTWRSDSATAPRISSASRTAAAPFSTPASAGKLSATVAVNVPDVAFSRWHLRRDDQQHRRGRSSMPGSD